MTDQAADTVTTKPTAAGIYDVYLGGTHHTDLEREAATQLRQAVPEAEIIAGANRAFHQRATRWLAEQGVRQFLDLGAGLPTQDNTHQVVQRSQPDARVLYVDHDTRTVARGQEIVADDPNTAYIQADVCKADELLAHPALRELLDLSQPVGVLSTAVMHFVSDERGPVDAIATYLRACAPGSYLALSHVTADKQPPAALKGLYGVYKNTNESIYLRSREQVELFFAGLDIVPPYDGADPKLSYISLWAAEDPVAADDDSGRWLYSAVARRP